MNEVNWPTRIIRKLTSWTHRFDDKGTKRDRAMQLAGVVFGTGALFLLIDWRTDSGLFQQLFFPSRCEIAQPETCPPIAWKDLFQATVLLLGLPVAFMLWHWRDRNVRDAIEEQRKQVENARKDINLKEFQEVQLRAAGALDEKLPQEAREQLQIAALHQLRGFLRGDYGESFKRPAFELLLAGHAAAIYRIGVPEVQAQLTGKSRAQVSEAVAALRKCLTPIDRTRMLIIRDEAAHIFTHDFPLYGRRFDLLNLSKKRFPENLDLSYSHFFGAELIEAHLEAVYMFAVHIEGAHMHRASLEGANLTLARLQYADLIGARLEGTRLHAARLIGADMRDAVSNAKSDFVFVLFNAATQFGETILQKNWPDLTEAQREEARAPWIARGMINVDEQPPEPADG